LEDIKVGWLYRRDPVPASQICDIIRDEVFWWTSPGYEGKVLDIAKVGSTVYAAVSLKRPEDDKAFVFAGVVLVRNGKDGFGYKDMDETVGPMECDCPDRIMRLLSPVEDLPRVGYAAEWRARVAARKAEKKRLAKVPPLKVGDVVTLPDPVTFGRAGKARTFRVTRFRGRTPIFAAVELNDMACQLRRETVASARIGEGV
jgi:ribosomal protein L19